jgi:two-component system response regulator MprA
VTTRLLLVEDEPALARGLADNFRAEGYEVRVVGRGDQVVAALRESRPDLVVLDVMLPGRSGLDVLRDLRAGGDALPVLMLTAKGDVVDRVVGLELGADDYLPKPFAVRELLARVRALLRRTQPERIPVLKFADLTLDTGSRQASRNNRVVSLTAKEYELLELFMRHPKQVMTREVIFDRVWGYDFGGESNVLEVYIRYLRQKLEADSEPRLIHTVRGVGYVLREE